MFETKYVQSLKKVFYSDDSLLELHPYIVPLKDVKGKLEINWCLIKSIMVNVTNKLLEVIYMKKSKQRIIKDLNVDSTFIKANHSASVYANSSLTGIWDDKFTGVRYVKLAHFRSNVRWDKPLLHLERRNIPPPSAQLDSTYHNIELDQNKQLADKFLS